jgi:8-oxo-dGTP pyrophosphatase MutT (NUDIX family)
VDDARLAGLRRALEARPAAARERTQHTLEAAVALLVRPREQLELLLIKRAIHDRDPWSGHVALPGGRRDHSDADLLDTAMRETDEEVGIALPKIGTFVGALDEVVPGTTRLPPLLIAPFVFAVPTTTAASINTREVDAAIWVPLAALRDEHAVSEILIELEGGARTFPSLTYGEYVIWGLTHRILTQFLDITVGLA